VAKNLSPSLVKQIVRRALVKQRKHVRDAALEALDMARFEFEHGDKRALLSAMYLCSRHGTPLPRWLADAFVKTFRDAKAFKYRSWDDAFGRPRPKSVKEARGLRKDSEPLVWLKACDLHAKGQPLDDDMFHKISAELKIHGATAATLKRVYYNSDYKRDGYKSLETFLYVVKTLRQLGCQAEAGAWTRSHFEGHRYGDILADLILNSH
jgi:hypothetical protein